MPFTDFALDPSLLAGVADLGFVEPTAIQSDAIPPALEGRDVLGAAMTGSGKTAAYVLPILHQLLPLPRGTTRALVLAPTRELAAQVEEHLRGLAARTELTAATVYGGVAFEPQERAFRRGVDVIIATPGRLLDHLRRPYASLDGVELLVLDEADRMLDMGFIPDVRRILRQMPARRQTLLFSATMPGPIIHLAAELLKDPATINIERRAAPATGITQVVYPVRHELKPALLLHLLRHGDIDSALAFTRTKERADRISGYLETNGVSVHVIHGDRTQANRSRALEAFKAGECQVLVATDVAARGLDLVGLSHVVNVDVPAQPEDYIHRVGRTARYEDTGDAITFVAARELAALHLIEKSIGQKLPRLTAEGFDYEPKPAIAPPPPAHRPAVETPPAAVAEQAPPAPPAGEPTPEAPATAPPERRRKSPAAAGAMDPAVLSRFAALRARQEDRWVDTGDEPEPPPPPSPSRGAGDDRRRGGDRQPQPAPPVGPGRQPARQQRPAVDLGPDPISERRDEPPPRSAGRAAPAPRRPDRGPERGAEPRRGAAPDRRSEPRRGRAPDRRSDPRRGAARDQSPAPAPKAERPYDVDDDPEQGDRGTSPEAVLARFARLRARRERVDRGG